MRRGEVCGVLRMAAVSTGEGNPRSLLWNTPDDSDAARGASSARVERRIRPVPPPFHTITMIRSQHMRSRWV